MASKVVVLGTLRLPPHNVAEVLPHLRVLVESTYKNDGCIAYDVAEDPFDPGLIRFSEVWPNREALNKHLDAPHIEPWRHAARLCGLIGRKFESYDVKSEPIQV